MRNGDIIYDIDRRRNVSGEKGVCRETSERKREDFTDGTSCAFSDIYHAKVLFHFHEYIRRMLEQEMSVQDLAEQLWMKNPDLVLISNELGYGVVPMDVFDRNYRETTGRVCTEIASWADAVYRVVCGIGTKIK